LMRQYLMNTSLSRAELKCVADLIATWRQRLHMLFLDGIYADNKHGTSRFRRVKAPTSDELTQLTHTIAHRVGRYLERLCRYIARPAVSTKRLSLTRNGQVRYELKTPYRNGATHVIFEPLDFISRRVALIPKPRVNLTRRIGRINHQLPDSCKYCRSVLGQKATQRTSEREGK